MDQMKKNFDALGSALSSGNLDDAKKAFAEIQKNAPKDGKTPSEITDARGTAAPGRAGRHGDALLQKHCQHYIF